MLIPIIIALCCLLFGYGLGKSRGLKIGYTKGILWGLNELIATKGKIEVLLKEKSLEKNNIDELNESEVHDSDEGDGE